MKPANLATLERPMARSVRCRCLGRALKGEHDAGWGLHSSCLPCVACSALTAAASSVNQILVVIFSCCALYKCRCCLRSEPEDCG